MGDETGKSSTFKSWNMSAPSPFTRILNVAFHSLVLTLSPSSCGYIKKNPLFKHLSLLFFSVLTLHCFPSVFPMTCVPEPNILTARLCTRVLPGEAAALDSTQRGCLPGAGRWVGYGNGARPTAQGGVLTRLATQSFKNKYKSVLK